MSGVAMARATGYNGCMKRFACIFASLFAFAANAGIVEDSALFLDAPYMAAPLGEGGDGPLWRLDAFDCVTFVETVLALGDDDFVQAMLDIRYRGGEVSFLTRNHFMNPDWIANNARLVRDITERVANEAGIVLKTRRTTLDRKRWFKKVHGIETEFEPEEVSLGYIAIADILANKEIFSSAINEPIIANIVARENGAADKYGTDSDIAHTGFLIPARLAGADKSGAAPVFRHASKRRGKVADDDFFEYLKFLSKHGKYIGVNLLGIND